MFKEEQVVYANRPSRKKKKKEKNKR